MRAVYILTLSTFVFGCTPITPQMIAGKNECKAVSSLDSIEVDCGSYTYSIPKPKDGKDGKDGADGTNGQDAAASQYDIVSVLDPCGDTANVVDEVLLKLRNGQTLASFSDSSGGSNTRFSLIGPGNYVTTDGSNCYFTIDADGNMINDHRS